MSTRRLLGYLWTFRRTYVRARRQAPADLQLEAAVEHFLDASRLPRARHRNGPYSPCDTTVTRSTVKSFYRMAALHCFLGRQYADLMGRTPTPRQWQTLATVGALAKIEDFIVDCLPRFSEEEHDGIYADPYSYQPTSLAGALFKHTFVRLLKLMPPDEYPEYHRVLKEIYGAQKESRRQQKQSATLGELKRITMRKGGYGIMAGLHVLNPHLNAGDVEYEALVSIGQWGQMIEDILDELEDRRQGIRTLVTEMHPAELERHIVQGRDRTLKLIGGLSHYSARRREQCLFRIFLPSVPAIARLRQLASGRDIFEDWAGRRFLRTGGIAVDFLQQSLALMSEFDPTRYIRNETTRARVSKEYATCR